MKNFIIILFLSSFLFATVNVNTATMKGLISLKKTVLKKNLLLNTIKHMDTLKN